MVNYIEYNYNDPEYATVADLMTNEPLLRAYGGQSLEFLDYKGDTEVTNRTRIINQLERPSEYGSTADDLLPLTIGTTLLIPKSKLNTFSRNELFALNNIDEGDDGSKFTAFINNIQKQLASNPKYKSIKKSGKQGNFVDFYPQITVLVWSRVLNQVINISPFIYSCNTNSGDNTTTFQISLAPVIATSDIAGNWKIDRATVDKLGKNYNIRSSLFKQVPQFKENNFYFNKVISQNDLVFIQYETLELEKNQRERGDLKFTVPYSELPKRIYDVIGSVDTNTITTDPASSEIAIQIQGRDLSKFLVDDGTYFFYEELLGSLFPDTPGNEKLRNRIYGKIPELNALGFRSIEDQINTILRLYYVTGYVPSEIFESWENRNTDLESQPDKDKIELNEKNKDIASKGIDVNIKLSREFEGISENTVSETRERLLDFASFLKSNDLFESAVNWKSYTYNGKEYIANQLPEELYDFLIKKPTQTSIINTFAERAVSRAYTYLKRQENSNFNIIEGQKFREGIWQIFDVEVDPSVRNMLVYDSKLNEANGSILSSLQSIAEEPFLEIFSDTYGNRFKLIARRQPFNAKYYNELKNETVIDIEPEDVINTTLNFNNEEIYTWFYLQPTGITYQERTFVAYPSALILPEYVDIWGSRPYNKTTNFVPFKKKQDIDAQINTDLRSAVNDLKYMIDINAYLPFVRSGTITINGDRTIKKKQAIRLKQTGEIYHVDNVSNNYVKGQSIDRTTTLQVSRGMVEKYMNPNNPFNYFNIVRTNIDRTKLNTLNDNTRSDFAYRITQDWGVNEDVFKFFLNRRQFQ